MSRRTKAIRTHLNTLVPNTSIRVLQIRGAPSAHRWPIVVIGGLITSTFLSLLVIPVLFTYVDDGVQKLKGLFHRRHHVPVVPDAGAQSD